LFVITFVTVMKTCPTCGSEYGDDLNYCLNDGSPLHARPTSELSSQPTEIYRPETNRDADISTAETLVDERGLLGTAPTAKQFRVSAVEPSSRMGCVVSIGSVAAILMIVIGLGVAGLLYTTRRSTDTASLQPAPAMPPDQTLSNSTDGSANVPTGTGATPPPKPTASAAATPAGAIKTISGGVIHGKAVSLPKPPYPPAARAVRASGAVSVQVLVDTDGRVISASAVSGHPLLRAAAESAARSAVFEPTLLSGRPVRVSGVITYNFVP